MTGTGEEAAKFCEECLKLSIRIDDDGCEYHNLSAYNEAEAKHHPRVKEHQP